MSDADTRDPQRDANLSTFGSILKGLAKRFREVEILVFYDTEGETIDYYSFAEPYATRLAAAHHGVLFDSTRCRVRWMGMGDTEALEIATSEYESITVPVGKFFYLTMVAKGNDLNGEIREAMVETASKLLKEAGF